MSDNSPEGAAGGDGDAASDETTSNTARNVGVGCFTTVIGFFSGSMIGLLAGKFIEGAKGCVPPAGLPLCDWHVYAGWGGALGALSLPALVLNRLRRRPPAGTSKRG